jgi:LacI family transcriptional regulator
MGRRAEGGNLRLQKTTHSVTPAVKKRHDDHPRPSLARPPHVAVIVETSTSFGRRVVRGISRFARGQGPWSIYVEQRSIFDPPPPWLKRWHGEGIICNRATPEVDRAVRTTGVPVVDLGGPTDEPDAVQVLNNDAAIGRLAAEHLLGAGFRRLGFVGHSGVYWSDDRLGGFGRAATAAGATCEVFRPGGARRRRFNQPPWEEELGSMIAWLEGLQKPVGVMAANDFRAVQVLDAARQAGVAVPEQASVIGVDDEEVVAEAARPSLSTVIPAAEQIGFTAAETLALMMAGRRPELQQRRVDPLGIVTRQSTSALAIDDPFVAEAMKCIRENACGGIKVGDVLERVGMSRTALQRHMIESTGRGIHEHIAAAKVEVIKDLLARTDLSLPAIAERVGVTHATYLSTLFKRHTGMTLSDYRNNHQGT